jgi:hypothetical protein
MHAVKRVRSTIELGFAEVPDDGCKVVSFVPAEGNVVTLRDTAASPIKAKERDVPRE